MRNLKRYLAILSALFILAVQLPLAALAEGDMPQVERIEFEELAIVEGNGGYTISGYYRYEYTPEYTVVLKNGTRLVSEWGRVIYNGKEYYLSRNDGQSDAHPWGLGAHTVTASIFGYETSFTVTIIESPVERVEFEELSFIEGMGYEYVGDSGTTYVYYYTPQYTVFLKDGTALQSDRSGVFYKGMTYPLSFHDDQGEKPWGVGVHTVPATIMGYETSFTAKVVASPYRQLEILKVFPLVENENCYMREDGTVIYPTPEVLFRVTDKDGNSFFASTETETYVKVTTDQDASPWGVGKDNRFTLSYLNLSVEGTVAIEAASPFTYIEQDGGLYITGRRLSDQPHVDIPSEIAGKPVVGVLSLGEGNVQSITIPDSVTTIGEGAFWKVWELETVTVGSGVNNLSVDMFSSNWELRNIFVSENNPYFCDLDGIVYSKDMTRLVAYPLAKGYTYTVPATVIDMDILNADIYDFLNISIAEGSKMFVTVDGVTYNADKTRVIRCDTDKSGSYVMPDTVSEIADGAFTGCSMLNSVKVSEKVTEIAYAAFADCGALESISLPSGLQKIGERAFNSCIALRAVELPSSLRTIGVSAFAYTGLSAISLPDSVEEIGAAAFYSSSLESVTLPRALTVLERAVFEKCYNLSDITIPSSVKTICDNAFSECKALSSVSIPDSVTFMGENAFFCCSDLETVTFGKGLTAIPDGAFAYCGLKTVDIPQQIQTIGAAAFVGCPIRELHLPEGMQDAGERGAFADTAIERLTLPHTVTKITYENFAGCANLSEIDIPESVISMEGHAFDGTNWYTVQQDGAIYLEHVFYGYKGKMPLHTDLRIKDGTTVIADFALEENANLDTLILPEGLKTIGSWSLYNCSSLKELTIPASVSAIDTSAFVGCTSLTAIHVSPDNPYYTSVDGVLFSKDGTELLWCPNRQAAQYEVPAGVTRIATGAFSESGVSTVVIADPETKLCDYAVGYRVVRDFSPYFCRDFGWGGAYFRRMTTEIVCPENSSAYAYAEDNHMVVTVSNSAPTLRYINGTWYYVENGRINLNATTLCNFYGTWYYVENGVVNFNATTLFNYYGTWYYINGGVLDWSATTLVNYYGTWYYVEGGVLNWGATTLVNYYGTWYYVEGGVLNWGATTLVNYYGTWYYVEGGVLNWGATTLVNYYGTWYYVEGGVLNWGATTLVNFYGTWYYVEGGVLNWGVNTLCYYYGTWYYVENSAINWNANLFFNFWGTDYRVVNGVVVF